MALSGQALDGRKEQALHKFVIFVATGGFVGFSPIVPGTMGTIVGILVYFVFSSFPLSIYLLSTATLFVLGAWAAERAEIFLAKRDSPRIVIDEIVGYLTTMILIPFTPGNALFGFLLFRIFDIVKPPPAREIDRQMNGGFAVVLDDVVAGLYANLLMVLIIRWYPGFTIEIDQWIRIFI